MPALVLSGWGRIGFDAAAGLVIADAPGVYAGEPSTLRPGARRFPMFFRGPGNRLYLFGGRGFDAAGLSGYLDDLWYFDVALSRWVFVDGDTGADAAGEWGTLGVALATNRPSARNSAVTATDSAGNVWLYGGRETGFFGGIGFDSLEARGDMADLWRLTVP